MPWPAALQKCFTSWSGHTAALYGSPMLDAALGQVGNSTKVLNTLTGGTSESLRKYRDLSTNTKSVKGKAQHEAAEALALKQFEMNYPLTLWLAAGEMVGRTGSTSGFLVILSVLKSTISILILRLKTHENRKNGK
eukprot:gene46520-58006_t